MESKICVICDTEKSIDIIYKKYRDCKQGDIKKSLKRYYENRDQLSNQRKVYYERTIDVLLARSKLNQQNRKFERKTYKQQIEELN